jgi:hypothetical protein
MRCLVVMTVRFMNGRMAVAIRLWRRMIHVTVGFMSGRVAVAPWMWRSAGATARLVAFFDVVLGERAHDSTTDGSEEAVASLLANVGAGSTTAQGS